MTVNKTAYKSFRARALKAKLFYAVKSNSYNKIPVFIPSIRIGDRSRLIWRILEEPEFIKDREIILVIRKKEERIYSKLGLKYIIRDKKDESLSGAKNYIIKYCAKNNIDDCIIVDDDVFAFNFEKEINPIKGKLTLKNAFRFLEFFIKSTNSKVSSTSPGSSFYPYLNKESIVCGNNNGAYLWHFHVPTMIENKFIFDSAYNCGREDSDMLIQMRFAGIKLNKFILIAHPGNHDETQTVNVDVSYDDMAGVLIKKWGKEFVTLYTKKFKKQKTVKSKINFSRIDKLAPNYKYNHNVYLRSKKNEK